MKGVPGVKAGAATAPRGCGHGGCAGNVLDRLHSFSCAVDKMRDEVVHMLSSCLSAGKLPQLKVLCLTTLASGNIQGAQPSVDVLRWQVACPLCRSCSVELEIPSSSFDGIWSILAPAFAGFCVSPMCVHPGAVD